MQDDQEQETEIIDDDQSQDAEPPADDESQGEEESETSSDDDEKPPEEEDELDISFGDEKEDEKKPESYLVNDLRDRLRNVKKKYRKTLYELEQLQKPVQSPADPGPKPTLEACDYDADQYESKLDQWHEKKRQSDQVKQQAAARKEQEDAEWKKIHQNYGERRQTLKVKDFKEAEEEVIETLDIPKQNIILKYAKKPELIVYALGKSPAKLAEMAKMDDFMFSKELGRLEDNLKVGRRKPKTQPEKTIKSTGTLSGTVDRTREKLREEAARTGNYTKLHEYNRRKRRAAAG